MALYHNFHICVCHMKPLLTADFHYSRCVTSGAGICVVTNWFEVKELKDRTCNMSPWCVRHGFSFFKLWFCINAHAFLFSFTSIQSTWIQVKKIKLAIFNLVFQWIAYICLRQSTTVSNLHPIPISVGYMGWLGVYTHTLKSTHPFPGCIPDLWGLAEQQTIVEL